MMPRRYGNSDAMETYATTWTPGGSQTSSKAPGKAGPRGGYPAFLASGHGAYVTDIDGHQYLDFVAGLAAVGIGHAHPRVIADVCVAAASGSLLSLPTPDEAQTAEQFCRFLDRPWAQQVRWLKTGSEACEAAVRIARCATGRDLVLTVRAGYHGWHSWFQSVKPDHPGVPNMYGAMIHGLQYGDQQTWDDWLVPSPGEQTTKIAAVILEGAPIGGGGDLAFLERVASAARAHGAVVILDEMVWGLRLARGGASEYFDVEPDLACFGKALGNGVPIACVVGTRELMREAAVVSGTYGGDRLGLAAARAVMDVYASEPIVETLWARGERLMHGLRDAASRYTTGTMDVGGYPVHPVVGIRDDADHRAMSLILQGLADRGVLWHPAGANVMAAMTEADIDRAIAAWGEAVADVVAGRVTLRGHPYVAGFTRPSV